MLHASRDAFGGADPAPPRQGAAATDPSEGDRRQPPGLHPLRSLHPRLRRDPEQRRHRPHRQGLRLAHHLRSGRAHGRQHLRLVRRMHGRCPTGALVNKAIRGSRSARARSSTQVPACAPIAASAAASPTTSTGAPQDLLRRRPRQPGRRAALRQGALRLRLRDVPAAPDRAADPRPTLTRRAPCPRRSARASDRAGDGGTAGRAAKAGAGKDAAPALVRYEDVHPAFREATWDEALDLVAADSMPSSRSTARAPSPGSAPRNAPSRRRTSSRSSSAPSSAPTTSTTARASATPRRSPRCSRPSARARSPTPSPASPTATSRSSPAPTRPRTTRSPLVLQERRRPRLKLIFIDPRRPGRPPRRRLRAAQARHRRRLLQRDDARHHPARALQRGLRREPRVEFRRAGPHRRRLPAGDLREDLRRLRGYHWRYRPHLGRGGRRGRSGGWGSPSTPRHRQRPLPDLALPAHRQLRAPGHRAAPAARAEQRAGRERRGAHSNDVPGLPARREPRHSRKVRGGVGRRARPTRGLTVTEITKGALQGSDRGHVLPGREPVPLRPEHQQGEKSPGGAGFPGGAGHLPHRDGRVRRRDPAGDLVPGEDRHYTNTDRRVQIGRPALRPPGQARLDWEIVCEARPGWATPAYAARRDLRRVRGADRVPGPRLRQPGAHRQAMAGADRGAPTASILISTSGSSPATGGASSCPRVSAAPRSCPTRSTRSCSTPAGCSSTGTPAR